VREAVISLQQSGLLIVKRGAGGGIFVAKPSPEPVGEVLTLMLRLGQASIAELTEARLLIEPEVARLASQRATPEHLRVLQETIDRYIASVDSGEPRSLADMDFHVCLAETSHNIVLSLTLKSLVPLLYNSVRRQGFSQADRRRGIRDHQAILALVRSGEGVKAARALAKHIKRMATFWN